MRCEQSLGSPTEGKQTAVADIHHFSFDADLDRIIIGPITMDQCVIDSLSHRIAGVRIGLHPCLLIVGNCCFQIFQIDEVDHSVGHQQQRAMHFILVQELAAFKFSDLHEATADDLFSFAVKTQCAGSFQLAVCYKIQLLQKFIVRYR